MTFFDIHTHHKDETAHKVSVVNYYPEEVDLSSIAEYASIGVHPWHLSEINVDKNIALIEKYIENPAVRAIGECGLDKLTSAPIEFQTEVFVKQLLLANKFKKPVIIHCVKAFNELIEIKQSLKLTIPLLIHGFRGSQQLAGQLIKHGFYLSFGEAILSDALKLDHTIQSVPENAFFIETDDSKVDIQIIYEKIAFLRNKSLDQLCKLQKSNFYNTLLL